MSSSEKNKENFDNLLKRKEEIDFSKSSFFEYKKKEKIQKVFLNQISENRKVSQDTEVSIKQQIYFFNKVTNEFILLNKDYKNLFKKKIKIMKDALLKKLILEMFEKQQILYIFPKNVIVKEYDSHFKKFKEEFERKKIKEKKEEEKLKKLQNKKKEEFKNPIENQSLPIINNNDNNNDNNNNKNNIITEEFKKQISEDFNNNFNIEENLYIKMCIINISIPQPKPPNQLKEYNEYIKIMHNEIKRYIQKQNYSDADSWCNAVIHSVFSPKKDIKKELNENEHFKKRLYEKTKPIILNKTYIMEKMLINNKSLDYGKIIKYIENEYYKNYPNDYDINYLKITGRKCKYHINIKEWEQALKCINDIKNNCNNINESKELVEHLEKLYNEMKHMSTKNYKKRYEEFMKENKMFEIDKYKWAYSQQKEQLLKSLKEENENFIKLSENNFSFK